MKELSIEEKAKRYDKALEKMKSWVRGEHPECFTEAQKAAEFIFPELKESEDEKIRGAIIHFIAHTPTVPKGTINKKTMLDWLEKQQSVKEIVERCKNSWYNEGKIQGQIEGLSNEEKYQQGWHDAIEKQGEQEKSYDTCDSSMIDNNKPPHDEKRNFGYFEEKPTDKAESKFHEGEWITNGNYTWKIVEVKPLDYILQSQDGNIVDDTISYVDEQFHSFTIEDAKDGDVLATKGGGIFIYKELLYNKPFAYCGVDKFGVFKDCNYGDGLDWTPYLSDVTPATKEQRDLLFQKMKEDGYEWDEKKKELKKIKMLPTEWSEEDELSCFESALFTAFSDAWQSYLLGEEVNVKQWAKEQSKELLEAAKEELKGHNSAWSEEDNMMKNAISTIMQRDNCNDLVPTIGDMSARGFEEGDKVKVIIIKEK